MGAKLPPINNDVGVTLVGEEVPSAFENATMPASNSGLSSCKGCYFPAVPYEDYTMGRVPGRGVAEAWPRRSPAWAGMVSGPLRAS
jgi:hypothetical protein